MTIFLNLGKPTYSKFWKELFIFLSNLIINKHIFEGWFKKISEAFFHKTYLIYFTFGIKLKFARSYTSKSTFTNIYTKLIPRKSMFFRKFVSRCIVKYQRLLNETEIFMVNHNQKNPSRRTLKLHLTVRAVRMMSFFLLIFRLTADYSR